jgi:predicted permease
MSLRCWPGRRAPRDPRTLQHRRPAALIAGLGFAWVRLRQPFDAAFVTALTFYVGGPALTLYSLSRLTLPAGEILLMDGAMLTVLFAGGVLGALALCALRLPVMALLPSVMIPNTGNFGLPLSLFAFGEQGLGLAVVVFAVTSAVNNTIGQVLASGRPSAGVVLKSPVIYAVIVALALLVTATPLPRWLANTAQLLGAPTIPLMLMMLGVSLGQLRFASLRRGAIVAVLRVAIGLACGWCAAKLFGLEGAAAVLILQSSMPVAVVNYLFAQKFETEPQSVAASIMVSTLAAFVTVPALLLVLM